MSKLLISFLLVVTFIEPTFANHWRWRNRYNTHHYPIGSRTGSGISPGAATAIGLGVGVLGFVIGRTTKPKEVVYKESPNIQCKEFPITVTIDGEEKKARVTKCKSGDGDWKIPD